LRRFVEHEGMAALFAQLDYSPQTVVSSPTEPVPNLVLPRAEKPKKSVTYKPHQHSRVLFNGDGASLALALALLVAVGSSVHRHISDHISSTSLAVDELAAMTLAGFAAQLVDGSLGMGYGLTSSSVLVASGLSPAMASTSVHIAQLGTTGLSGLAHYRHGTVDTHVAAGLAPAGAVGAFAGAMLLTLLPVAAAKPVSSGLLFALGVYVLCRFYFCTGKSVARTGSPSRGFLSALGLVGGFVDATGGGGWGPVATSGLLADGRLTPQRTIGTVSAAEFAVTVAAVGGFVASRLLLPLLGLAAADDDGHAAGGAGMMRVDIVLALLVGGLLAAPVAPHLVTTLEPRLLGVVVGGFVCATNLRGLLKAGSATPAAFWWAYALLLGAWATAVWRTARGPSKVACCADAEA